MTKSLWNEDSELTASQVASPTSSTRNTPTNSAQSDSPRQAIACNHRAGRDDFDLRPKFAIIKHKSEILNQTTQESATRLADRAQSPQAITPAWFFNIPTIRTPFLDFGRDLSEE